MPCDLCYVHVFFVCYVLWCEHYTVLPLRRSSVLCVVVLMVEGSFFLLCDAYVHCKFCCVRGSLVWMSHCEQDCIERVPVLSGTCAQHSK